MIAIQLPRTPIFTFKDIFLSSQRSDPTRGLIEVVSDALIHGRLTVPVFERGGIKYSMIGRDGQI
jgi:hypothetical protein